MSEPTPVPGIPEPTPAPDAGVPAAPVSVAGAAVVSRAESDDNARDVPAPPMPPPVAAPTAAMAAGVPVFPNGKPMLDAFGNPVSDKSRLAAALLCWFVGVLGIHRFYVGKTGTGLLMLVTLGAFGIWALIDLVVILLGSFRDKSGKALQNW